MRYDEYFEGGMGAEYILKLIDRIDLDAEEIKLRDMIDAKDGRRPLSARSAARRRSSASRSSPPSTGVTTTDAASTTRGR